MDAIRSSKKKKKKNPRIGFPRKSQLAIQAILGKYLFVKRMHFAEVTATFKYTKAA